MAPVGVASPPEALNIAVGPPYLGPFLLEAWRALIGRLRNPRAALVTQESVKRYFESRMNSFEADASDIVAADSEPYQMLLRTGPIAELFAEGTQGPVLDFGCGTGGLRRMLRSIGFEGEYLGSDLNRPLIESLSRVNRDSRARFVVEGDDNSNFGVAIVCNALVYNDEQNAAKILRHLRSRGHAGATIVVLEPYPRFYWEFVFDGLRLCPRSPKTMTRLLRDAGWTVDQIVSVSLLTVCGIALVRIAYAVTGRAAA